MPQSTSWSFRGPFGPELWRRDAGRFTSVEAGPDRIGLPCDDVTAERLRVRDSRCPHPGPFPPAFRYCPECGSRLGEPVATASSQPWSPPFGADEGLPEIAEPRAPDPASQEEIAVPASPALGFAVAGTPPMLLACNRVGGWISAWSEAAGHWVERVQIPPCLALPRWSWAGAADRVGLAVPTDRGAAWIALDRPRTAAVTEISAGRPLGGAAGLRTLTAIPLQAASGMVVALLDRGQTPAWQTIPVIGAPPTSAPLAAPVANADRAVWCGQDGLLTVQAGADGVSAHWRGWRDDLQPLLGMRPVQEPDGRLHQPARRDAQTLVLEGLDVPERRLARGYAPGTGRAVFRENARLRLPWDERVAADYPLADDSFLLPLLGLDRQRHILAVCSHRAGFGRFLGDPAAPDDDHVHDCTLVYSRGPRTLEPLGCVLRARLASDLSVVIHGGWLYAYGAVDNRCHRWRLS